MPDPQAPSSPDSLTFASIRPGVRLATAEGVTSVGAESGRRSQISLNIGLICGTEIALLVDPGPASGDHAGLMERVRDVVSRESPGAELRVVSTHGHPDHTGANAYLREHGVEVVYAHRDAHVATATDLVGDEPLQLDLGGLQVSIEHLGRGHSAGDLVVGVTGEAGVLFCGDLVREGADPSFRDSYPREWLRVLGMIASFSGTYSRFVPGHGAVVDAEFIERMRRRMTEGHRVSTAAIREASQDATKAIPIIPYGPDGSRELITRLREM